LIFLKTKQNRRKLSFIYKKRRRKWAEMEKTKKCNAFYILEKSFLLLFF